MENIVNVVEKAIGSRARRLVVLSENHVRILMENGLVVEIRGEGENLLVTVVEYHPYYAIRIWRMLRGER